MKYTCPCHCRVFTPVRVSKPLPSNIYHYLASCTCVRRNPARGGVSGWAFSICGHMWSPVRWKIGPHCLGNKKSLRDKTSAQNLESISSTEIVCIECLGAYRIMPCNRVLTVCLVANTEVERELFVGCKTQHR